MFDARKIREDFSDAAPHYDEQASLQQYVLGELAARMLPLLPARALLLDAGCGTGRFARQYGEPHDVTQFDTALPMCRQARLQAPAIAAAVETLPFKNRVFDGVFCSLVLQWVNQNHLALEEMRRVLKSGGVMAVSSFGPDTLKELRESFAVVDAYPHVSSFAPLPECTHREIVTEHYPDLPSLMRHLKAIGARNKLQHRRKSLMTRAQMQRVERHYGAHYASPLGLPVTWEIRYWVARKP